MPQARAVALTFRAMVAESDLERRVDRLGARVRKEALRESFGGDVDDTLRELEGTIAAGLEAHRIIERRDLLLHGLDDLRVAVAYSGRPQTGEQVVDRFAVLGGVVMPFGTRDDPRLLLEVSVCRKRHPVCVDRG